MGEAGRPKGMGGDDAAAMAADASRARASRAKAGGNAGSARMRADARGRTCTSVCVDAYSTDIISSRGMCHVLYVSFLVDCDIGVS